MLGTILLFATLYNFIFNIINFFLNFFMKLNSSGNARIFKVKED